MNLVLSSPAAVPAGVAVTGVYVCVCVNLVLSSPAAVPAGVAASPTITTAVAAASASTVAGAESVTSATDGGVEFTLDASTLEQLRGAGDASALMESSAAATAGFAETASDDQPTMQVDGCSDYNDWTHGLIQLDGPMDSEDVAVDDGDEDASGDMEGDGQEEEAEDGDAADGGFGGADLDSAAEGPSDAGEAGFVTASESDELPDAAASAGFTAAELSSHTAALDADDPAAAYMMQVHTSRCLQHTVSLYLYHKL